jgi:NAD(P)-dependent dehydrogenase (short-subunit alcohol dehydrogenase family)
MRAVKRFGRLDIAVNAAGAEGKPGPAVEQTAESYAATFDTNVLGTILSMKHELRVMQAQGNGSIVNISSTFGHEGGAGASIYAASKHAVEGLTKSVALEVGGFGVRVNAVAPGPIQTAMLDRFTGGEEGKAYLATLNAQKRIGGPEEIAGAILYIASDDASFVTGHVLTVDGGKSAGAEQWGPAERPGWPRHTAGSRVGSSGRMSNYSAEQALWEQPKPASRAPCATAARHSDIRLQRRFMQIAVSV